ncbi:hypothetical protein HPB51_026115 [Rhipicephalus microplus]|uniref:Aladin seven-bladed propeller domain-containing protein n=1 Tax=Rhipicephalus microplus TaxID=6941 RepID=A0A9J6F6I6_RHIMP|nr:hypothetical protein HPB51_026115 [Rhipicephalus microplus]
MLVVVWAEQVVIALVLLDDKHEHIIRDSREMIRASSFGAVCKEAYHTLEGKNITTHTLTWFPTHTGSIREGPTNLNELACSKVRGLTFHDHGELPCRPAAVTLQFPHYPNPPPLYWQVRLALAAVADQFTMLLLSEECLARGHVRAFAWHPQCPKFAVASHGDMIRVYAPNMSITPVLKHRSQRNITDMAWKPYSSAVLAVACQEGVLLWQVEPTSLIARPSSAYASLLSREGHNPVSSIAWHPKGTLLASASAADCSLLIWNIAMEECVPLTHISGGGVSLIRWSPDGCRLLAASPQSLFRVWHTNQWQFDKWSTQQGRCRAACWSPDGRWLLCCFSDKPHLYALNFPPPVTASVDEDEGESSAWSPHPDATFGTGLPVADLTEVDLPLHSGAGEGIRVGGLVQNMAWDKHGERLAISFRDHSEYVALFRTKTSPVFQMFPW